ncbi:MAG: ATP-binding protein [Bdellovibrionia bacterium]
MMDFQMAESRFKISFKSSLRRQVLTFVGAMVLLSLVSSATSLLRITEVNRLLEAINHVSVPLGRLLAQMQSDAEVFRRELDRSLGRSHWKDPHWHPSPPPRWIEEVLLSEMASVDELIRNDSEWTHAEARAHWLEWSSQTSAKLTSLTSEGSRLYFALETGDEGAANEIESKWTANVEEWKRQLQWGASEYEHLLRRGFSIAGNRVVELRTSLELILGVVVLMSLLLLWLGERALRPLTELTQLARDITRRGLRKEDKALLPDLSLARKDEVNQLSREFHSMATSLLEREKTVESQNKRLQEQNRLLREMSDLRERLRQAESLAAVGRMSAQVAHEVRNPLHSIGLEAEIAAEMAARLGDPILRQSLQSILTSVDRLQKITENYLKLSQLSDGQKAVVDLGEVLNSVLATYAPVIENQGVQVGWFQEPHSSLLVWADRDLLEQVLGNLLNNSLQALALHQKSGTIFWRLGNTESGMVWLRIEDNGPGIAADSRDKIFTPFFTTRAQGTGLGLSFIKKVLEDHGGKISNVVQPEGQGACFEVIIPLIDMIKSEVSLNAENSIGR